MRLCAGVVFVCLLNGGLAMGADIAQPILVELTSAATMPADCDLSGCVDACMMHVAVQNNSALDLAWAGMVYYLPSPNDGAELVAFEISAYNVPPGATGEGANHTLLASCEALDLDHPGLDCVSQSDTRCVSMVRYINKSNAAAEG